MCTAHRVVENVIKLFCFVFGLVAVTKPYLENVCTNHINIRVMCVAVYVRAQYKPSVLLFEPEMRATVTTAILGRQK